MNRTWCIIAASIFMVGAASMGLNAASTAGHLFAIPGKLNVNDRLVRSYINSPSSGKAECFGSQYQIYNYQMTKYNSSGNDRFLSYDVFFTLQTDVHIFTFEVPLTRTTYALVSLGMQNPGLPVFSLISQVGTNCESNFAGTKRKNDVFIMALDVPETVKNVKRFMLSQPKWAKQWPVYKYSQYDPYIEQDINKPIPRGRQR